MSIDKIRHDLKTVAQCLKRIVQALDALEKDVTEELGDED